MDYDSTNRMIIEGLFWCEDNQPKRSIKCSLFAGGFSHAAFIDVTRFMSLSFNCQLLRRFWFVGGLIFLCVARNIQQ
jgi:hypothetical protein